MNNGLKYVSVDKLKNGMTLGETIYDDSGNILLSKGIILKELYINKIKALKIDNVYIEVVNICNHDKDSNNSINQPKRQNTYALLYKTKCEAREIIKKTFNKVSFNNSSIKIERVIEIVNVIVSELLDNDKVLGSLDELRSVDDYTFEHSVNVCVLALILGINLKYERKDLIELGIGAILHDIGKMLVPNEIINKPGPLTTQEYEIVKKHTTYGYEVLKTNNDRISDVAAKIVLCHHERPDGLGYPNGIKNKLIHTFSKIVAITDVYDALTSDRVYKKKVESTKAVEYLMSMGGIQFDYDLVHSFIECVGIYPVGSIVRLNTNETGIVIAISRLYPQKPIVKVLIDKYGNRLNKDFEIDIRKNPDISILNLVKQKQKA